MSERGHCLGTLSGDGGACLVVVCKLLLGIVRGGTSAALGGMLFVYFVLLA